MTTATSSATAQRVAMRRAAHQLLDDPPVFEDPLALAVIGEEAAGKLKRELSAPEAPGSRQMRAFMAARSRYAEDQLAAAVGRGAMQYVVLGAGLDTYAYRNSYPGLRVFEVDHPLTQTWKRDRLAAGGIRTPASLTFVATDFEAQTLHSVLQDAGFQTGEVSFFSWLGVAPYLTAEAAMATVAFIGSMPVGSGVVFDYAVERSSLSAAEQMAMDALASRIARAGEPFRLFIDPRALEEMLRAAGFHTIEDLGAAAIDRMYFDGRGDDLRVSAGHAHIVNARV
jgi:methyltransferase (TIGR00027 family)